MDGWVDGWNEGMDDRQTTYKQHPPTPNQQQPNPTTDPIDQVKDTITGEEWTIRSKVVVNSTGVFADGIRKMDNPDAVELIEPAAGGLCD